MKRTSVLSLATAIGAIIGAPAFGSDDAGSFYVSPLLQYYEFDQNSPGLKDNFGYQGGAGYSLLHEWAIEANFSRGDFDIPNSDAMRRLTGYSLDVIRKFFPDAVIRPYAIAGGGLLDDTFSAPGTGANTFHTYLAEAGVGLLTGLGSQTGSTRVQLRTEAKYRMEWANPDRYGVKDPSGLIFGVGVQMNFGAPVEKPVVYKEREAPPPPPPPPAADAAAAEGRHSTAGRELCHQFGGSDSRISRSVG